MGRTRNGGREPKLGASTGGGEPKGASTGEGEPKLGASSDGKDSEGASRGEEPKGASTGDGGGDHGEKQHWWLTMCQLHAHVTLILEDEHELQGYIYTMDPMTGDIILIGEEVRCVSG